MTNYPLYEVAVYVKDGAKLDRRITRLRKSKRALAAEIGWKSHTYLQRLCRGEARAIDEGAALLLASLLEVEVDDYFTYEAHLVRGRRSTDPRRSRVPAVSADSGRSVRGRRRAA